MNFTSLNDIELNSLKVPLGVIKPTKGSFSVSFVLLSVLSVFLMGNYGANINNGGAEAFAAAPVGENGQNLQQTQQLQPSINAKSIFETKTAVLGNNVKNLIVLIPDEAHHGNGEAKEARFIEQSFLPQKAIVNKGTNVIWFSGDVMHEHKILVDGGAPNSFSPSPYDSGVLTEFTASTPVAFNAVGNYKYSSPEIDQKAEQKGFVMSGEVEVVNQPSKLTGTTPNTATAGAASVTDVAVSSSPQSNMAQNGNIETVGMFMVPTKKVDTYLSQFNQKGLAVDSTYSFKDLRGLARGTDSEQTLVVWTAGQGMNVDSVLASLKEIAPSLPYK